MADLTSYNVSPVFTGKITQIRSGLGSNLAQNQSVYLDPTSGTYMPTSSASSATANFRGLIVSPPIGYPNNLTVDVVESGYVSGFDLSTLKPDDLVYVSDTPGKLSSTPGTVNAVVGRVAVLTDNTYGSGLPSKILYVRPTPF